MSFPAREKGGKRIDPGAPGQGTGRDPAGIEKQFIAKARPRSLLQRFETPGEVAALFSRNALFYARK